jgi:hypothetical protein
MKLCSSSNWTGRLKSSMRLAVLTQRAEQIVRGRDQAPGHPAQASTP